ncbi:hypothetical protein ACWGJB_32845 [Streptomyces sp. NPDC054813]
MDLRATVTAFPRATPIDGLDRAWTWRLNPVLNFAGALTGDGTRLLQMNQVRRRDDALAGAVLAFAHAHESELITEGHFLTVVGGFDARWRLLGRRAIPARKLWAPVNTKALASSLRAGSDTNTTLSVA